MWQKHPFDKLVSNYECNSDLVASEVEKIGRVIDESVRDTMLQCYCIQCISMRLMTGMRISTIVNCCAGLHDPEFLSKKLPREAVRKETLDVTYWSACPDIRYTCLWVAAVIIQCKLRYM